MYFGRVPVIIFDTRSHLRFEIGTAAASGSDTAIRFEHDFMKVRPLKSTPATVAADLKLWDKVEDLQLADEIEIIESEVLPTYREEDFGVWRKHPKTGLPERIAAPPPPGGPGAWSPTEIFANDPHSKIPTAILVSLLIMLGRGKVIIDGTDMQLAQIAINSGAEIQFSRYGDPLQVIIELKEPE